MQVPILSSGHSIDATFTIGNEEHRQSNLFVEEEAKNGNDLPDQFREELRLAHTLHTLFVQAKY